MLKSTKCPDCGGKMQISGTQESFICLYCGGEFFTENPPKAQRGNPVSAAAESSAESTLKIEVEGIWMAVDLDVKVFIDGQLVGSGSIKKGFNVTTKIEAGKHILLLDTKLKNKSYDFEISSVGNYQTKITYSRTWGNFSSEFNLNKL
jgi:hypothetical protein